MIRQVIARSSIDFIIDSVLSFFIFIFFVSIVYKLIGTYRPVHFFLLEAIVFSVGHGIIKIYIDVLKRFCKEDGKG